MRRAPQAPGLRAALQRVWRPSGVMPQCCPARKNKCPNFANISRRLVYAVSVNIAPTIVTSSYFGPSSAAESPEGHQRRDTQTTDGHRCGCLRRPVARTISADRRTFFCAQHTRGGSTPARDSVRHFGVAQSARPRAQISPYPPPTKKEYVSAHPKRVGEIFRRQVAAPLLVRCLCEGILVDATRTIVARPRQPKGCCFCQRHCCF